MAMCLIFAMMTSLLLRGRRAASLRATRSPRLCKQRAPSLTGARSPRLRRRRAPSLTGALPLALGVELCGVGDCLVVVVRDVVLGDLIGRGLPDTIMGHHIIENLVQVLHPVRLADQIGVQGNAHDAPTFCALLVELVKLRFAHAHEVVPFVVLSEGG